VRVGEGIDLEASSVVQLPLSIWLLPRRGQASGAGVILLTLKDILTWFMRWLIILEAHENHLTASSRDWTTTPIAPDFYYTKISQLLVYAITIIAVQLDYSRSSACAV